MDERRSYSLTKEGYIGRWRCSFRCSHPSLLASRAFIEFTQPCSVLEILPAVLGLGTRRHAPPLRTTGPTPPGATGAPKSVDGSTSLSVSCCERSRSATRHAHRGGGPGALQLPRSEFSRDDVPPFSGSQIISQLSFLMSGWSNSLSFATKTADDGC